MMQTTLARHHMHAPRAVHPVAAYPRTTIYLTVMVALILLMVML